MLIDFLVPSPSLLPIVLFVLIFVHGEFLSATHKRIQVSFISCSWRNSSRVVLLGFFVILQRYLAFNVTATLEEFLDQFLAFFNHTILLIRVLFFLTLDDAR